MGEFEQKLRTLVEHIPDHIACFDAQCRYLFISPSMERDFGLSPEDFIGKGICETGKPGDVAQNRMLEGAIRRTFENGESHSVEARWITYEGVRYFDILYVPEKDDGGEVVSVLGVAHDITRRKRAELELQQREQEFRTLAEGSPDFIIRYDRTGRILYLNRRLQELLGIPYSELIGRHPSTVWPDGRYASLQQAVNEVAEKAEPVTVELVEPVNEAAGVFRYHQVVVVPEHDATGEAVGAIAFGRDVTDYKGMEKARTFR